MSLKVSYKICKYISEEIRPNYTSNRELADVIGIDEKTIRKILDLNYNISSDLLKKVCDSQNLKMSELFSSIGE